MKQEEETLLLPSNSHVLNENKISLESSLVSFINQIIKKTSKKMKKNTLMRLTKYIWKSDNKNEIN